MHGLDVIILRNAKAAGREQAHDDIDTGFTSTSKLQKALLECIATALEPASVIAAYVDGYWEGMRDR